MTPKLNALGRMWNDYTAFTSQDPEFELELVLHAVGKKMVDNKVLIHFLLPSFRLTRFF